MGGRRRRLRAHCRDAAAVGAARGGRRLRRAVFPAHRRAVRGLLAGLSGGGRAAAAGWDGAIDALDGLAEQLAGLRAMLADHTRTSIRLVLTPERVVAAETRRTLTALALHGLRVDGIVVNRVVPGPPPSLRGPAARWLRERYTEQQAVLGELRGLGGVSLATVDHTAAEPTGVPALLEVADNLYAGADPAAAGPAGPSLLRVRRTRGEGTARDSEFELALALPGAADGPLELARVGRRVGGRGGWGATACGAAFGVAAVHGHYGPSRGRRPVRRRSPPTPRSGPRCGHVPRVRGARRGIERAARARADGARPGRTRPGQAGASNRPRPCRPRPARSARCAR